MWVLLWDLAVAFAVLGFGFTILRVLRMRSRPLALAGSAGLSFVLFLGGWLNLASLLRSEMFFLLAGVGVLCFVLECFRSRVPIGETISSFRARVGELRTADVVLAVGGFLAVALLALGALRQVVWNNDDVSGYIPLAIKALQSHSIGSDPFCDRRISSSVGGGIFVDALMYAVHDLRGMAFIDSGFGLLLLAAAIWALAREWRLSVGARGLLLLCIPVFTLMKVNLTAVYLSAAGFLAISLLFAQMKEEEEIGWRHGLLLGLILGGMSMLKSTNLVFICLVIAVSALLYKALRRHASVLGYAAASYPIAALLLLPWCINQHRTEGTYLYPLLGKGFYASAYGLIPPLQTPHFLLLGAIVAVPARLLLLAGFILAWKRTEMRPVALRVSVLGYLAAAMLAAPITGAGLAGDSVDRYVAPFVMPGFLLLLLLVLAPAMTRQGEPQRAVRLWEQVPLLALLAIVLIYVAGFVGWHLRWYTVEYTVVEQALGTHPERMKGYERLLDATHKEALQQETARIQAAVPEGATILATLTDATALDYRRQHILIADYPGMVGPPPGMPINSGAQALLKYLRSQGVEYVAYDRGVIDPAANWQDYSAALLPPNAIKQALLHPGGAHKLQPLGIEQRYVSQRVGEQLRQLALMQPVVFDDGDVFVMSLNTSTSEPQHAAQAPTAPGISR